MNSKANFENNIKMINNQITDDVRRIYQIGDITGEEKRLIKEALLYSINDKGENCDEHYSNLQRHEHILNRILYNKLITVLSMDTYDNSYLSTL